MLWNITKARVIFVNTNNKSSFLKKLKKYIFEIIEGWSVGEPRIPELTTVVKRILSICSVFWGLLTSPKFSFPIRTNGQIFKQKYYW